MVKVEARFGEAKRESTENAEVKGKTVEFLWYMKKQGYSEETIKTYASAVRKLVKANLNLMNPEDIKEFLAKQNFSNAYK